MRGLREMFNINYFLCSQTNPHIVPALNIKKHVPRTLADLAESEFKHRCALDPTTVLNTLRSNCGLASILPSGQIPLWR